MRRWGSCVSSAHVGALTPPNAPSRKARERALWKFGAASRGPSTSLRASSPAGRPPTRTGDRALKWKGKASSRQAACAPEAQRKKWTTGAGRTCQGANYAPHHKARISIDPARALCETGLSPAFPSGSPVHGALFIARRLQPRARLAVRMAKIGISLGNLAHRRDNSNVEQGLRHAKDDHPSARQLRPALRPAHRGGVLFVLLTQRFHCAQQIRLHL